MGIGREVADAYISVHGDLAPFREDLNDANASMADWAKENADSLTDAWGARMRSQMDRQWNSVIDALHSGKKVDFNRMIENFDLDNLDAAERKIDSMLDALQKGGKLSAKQMEEVSYQIGREIEQLKKQQKLEADIAADRDYWARAAKIVQAQNAQARKKELAETKAFADAQRKMWAEAIRMNKDHDASVAQRGRIHESMMKAIAASERKMLNDAYQMNKDHDARLRQSAKIREQIQKNLLAAERDMLTEAYRMNADHDTRTRTILKLREKLEKQIQDARSKRMDMAIRENEAWARSFKGITAAAKKMDLENKFKAIGQAMATGDWSRIANGAKNMGELSRRTMETAREMRSLGRITQTEFEEIEKRLRLVSKNVDAYNIKFATTAKQVKDHKNDWTIISTLIGNAGKKFAGFSGLNVMGDMFRQGSAFFQDLDRNAVNIGKMSVLIGSTASTIISAVGGLAVMGQDLAALGNIGILAPGFLIAAGIQMGVLVAAFKDMGEVLGDLEPQFAALQDVISANFWAQAEAPIRNLVDSLLPTLETQLGNTATSLGGLTGAFATALAGIDTGRITSMFERMNSAIDIAQGIMQPLVDAFTTLGEVASLYFEDFATWLVELSEGFNTFIQGAAEDGRLQEWIDRAIQGFKDVGSIIGSVVGIFNAVATAAEAAGIGGLTSFATTMANISAIMNSAGFQETLTTLFTGAADAAGSIGQALVDLGPQIATFMPTVSAALSTIGEIAATVIGYIGDIFTNPMVMAGITQFLDGIQGGIAVLQPAIQPLAESMGQIMALLGQVAEQVGIIVSVMVTSLTPVLDTVTAAFSRITFAAGPEIVQIMTILGEAMTTVVNTLLPPLENLIMTIMPLFADALTMLAPLWDVVATAIAPVIEAVQQLVAQIAPVLIPAIGEIVAALTPVIEVFGQVVGAILDFVVPILGALLIGVIQNLVGVFQGLSDFIMGFVQIVTAIFQGFGDFFTALFTDGIGAALGTLGNTFKNIWDGIVKMLGGAVTAIWNAIQLWIVGKMVAGIKTALTGAKSFFTSIWSNIVSFLNTAVSNITRFITSGFTAAGNFIRTIWNTVLGIIRGVWNTITGAISTSMNTLANRIMSGLNSVKSFFSTAWNGMVAILRTAWNNIKSGVSTGISNVMSFIQNLPGRISRALGNLGTLLLGAGQAIIDGLLQGLKNAWGGVTDFVGGIASWIADNKGPLPYDRRLLIPAGNAIMEGLGKGLEDKLGMLKNILDAVTDTMTDSVTDAFSKNKMYLAGADAALGLADGLKSNKNAVASALNAVMPTKNSTVGMNITAPGSANSRGVEGPTPATTSIVVEAGAIPITTPTKDPALVANKVIDGIVTTISNL